jgi:hypothetical protein
MAESRFKEVRTVRRELQDLVRLRVVRQSGRKREGDGKPDGGRNWRRSD